MYNIRSKKTKGIYVHGTQCTNIRRVKFNFQLYDTVIYYDYSNNQTSTVKPQPFVYLWQTTLVITRSSIATLSSSHSTPNLMYHKYTEGCGLTVGVTGSPRRSRVTSVHLIYSANIFGVKKTAHICHLGYVFRHIIRHHQQVISLANLN